MESIYQSLKYLLDCKSMGLLTFSLKGFSLKTRISTVYTEVIQLNTSRHGTSTALGCKPQCLAALIMAPLDPFSTKPVFVLRTATAQMQDLARGLAEPPEVPSATIAQHCQGRKEIHARLMLSHTARNPYMVLNTQSIS